MMLNRLVLLIVLVNIVTMVFTEELYSDKYDNQDVDAILANEERRLFYYHCFLGSGPCSEDGEFFKNHFPEAVINNCAKCTQWQKDSLDKIAVWYTAHDEAAWNALVNKFVDESKKIAQAA